MQNKTRDYIGAGVIGLLVPILFRFVADNISFPQAVMNYYSWLYLILPILCLAGIFISYYIGQKLPILYQIAKFVLVGVLNTAIDFAFLNYLISATGIVKGAELGVLNAISFTASVTNSFFWNKYWVFNKSGSESTVEFIQFFVVSLVGAIINSLVVIFVTGYITPLLGFDAKQWANASKILATIIAMSWNFVGYKLVVFKKKTI